ncbi:hypothetical protein [Marinobacter changyiensis]|uniref:hypothetical protein n=1 Tax=Marinobacter changyiensis TaxID=2604091 RepID=UPI0012647E4B|nr:hypothetical protein [Marinobacter changyiensis]
MKHLSLIAVLALLFAGTAVAEGVDMGDIKCETPTTCVKIVDLPTLPDSLTAERFHQDVL